ncbi:MAG: S-methyl-5'-thioadenosine phosphorylase [Planctomycetia bacterium]|jgi:5'-methylthioadenosine phosphorylase|nr:S-methyl-5'-thioadenosine phosphorylase [Planctomycetia bacterium]MCC7316462.1 S-methyl-5'-thioadenosine phosphorylase [Planctomycetota bacterium]OQZ00594.1 MAG: methylthioadenosine phosphorylase [Planctomycetes bacterium UTPLA1]
MATEIIGLIGGTGLGHALAGEIRGAAVTVETPFGPPSAPITRGKWEGVEIAFLPRHGPSHTFGPSAVPYRSNIYALKSVGVTRIIASGATGSLREEIRPRDLVIADQVIDRTYRRSSSFFDEPGIAAHVEFAEPFCPAMRRILLDSGGQVQTTLHDGGTYVCMEGPAFSTVAESRMHRSWGGDLIGMTCMPEAKLAREAEMCYALVALPTDYDCWRPHDPGADRTALLKEIIHNVEVATANSVHLIRAALRRFVDQTPAACTCQSALAMAVWTKHEAITAETRRRLGPIAAKYFS